MRSILPLPLTALILATSVCPASKAAPVAPQPNILLIVADDLGWADLGCYGAADIATPTLDRLAQQGVRFTQFYANGPECTPTRAALLTGRYQQRIGGLECAIGTGGVGRYDDAIRLDNAHQLGLPADETSIAHLLKTAGYATAIAGKWHLGYEDHFSPNRHGFDHAFYSLGGGMDYFHHVEDPPHSLPVLRLNEQPVKRPGYFTELVVSDAVSWLRSQHARTPAQPCFIYLPFTAPHSPYQGPDELQPAPLPPDSPRWKQGRAPPEIYAAMIESMDREIGRMLSALDELEMARNTVVIFISDNGGTSSARPTGLRDIKGTTFEGGIRVPAIVRWPDVLPAGSEYHQPAATFDLTASIARIAGADVPDNRTFDGIDILRYAEKSLPPPDRTLFWRGRRADRTWRAVREGELKYVSFQEGAKIEEWLFNIARDPGEKISLIGEKEHSTDLARLQAKLTAWETAVKPVR